MATTQTSLRTVAANGANTTTVSNFLNGASAFYDGLVFTLTGSANVQIVKDGEQAPAADAPMNPVFRTSVREDAFIWLSSYKPSKQKLDLRGNTVVKDGTFDQLVFNELAKDANRNVDAVMAAVLAAVNGRQLRVRRKPYEGLDRNAQKRVLSIVCIDFV